MKSIIFSFLLLSTTLSLVPFVAFSSTFTSDNPIVLPNTATDEDNGFPVPVLPEVLDSNGEPLQVGQEYLILSDIWGVDLAKIGNTRCPNAVVLHEGQPGIPVKFFTRNPGPAPSNVVRESNDINIMFSIPSTPRCENGTFWIVGKPERTARWLRFVETSRVLVAPDSYFQIEKFPYEASLFYRIMHCPSQGVDCIDVGVTSHMGHDRLALNYHPFFLIFKKVDKTDA